MRLWCPIQVVSSAGSERWFNVSSEGNGNYDELFHNNDFCTLADVASAAQVSVSYAFSLGYITLIKDFATFEQRIGKS